MCLITIAHRAHEQWPFVIAANRDESHERPAARAGWWSDAPDVIGGRDLRAGGSWLAASRGGRVAAVTNIRGAVSGARSRGLLVSEFVTGSLSPLAYLQTIDGSAYAGFHLVVATAGDELAHYTNDGGEPRVIAPGSIVAFSNGGRGEEWPKMELATDAMREALAGDDPRAALLAFLTTHNGRGGMSEVFVVSDVWGTRASTVVTYDARGALAFEERRFGKGGVPEE